MTDCFFMLLDAGLDLLCALLVALEDVELVLALDDLQGEPGA